MRWIFLSFGLLLTVSAGQSIASVDTSADFSREYQIIEDFKKEIAAAEASLEEQIGRLHGELKRLGGENFMLMDKGKYDNLPLKMKAAVLRSAIANYAFSSLHTEYQKEIEEKSRQTDRKIVKSGSSMHLDRGSFEACYQSSECSLPSDLEDWALSYQEGSNENEKNIFFIREDKSKDLATVVDIVITSQFDTSYSYMDMTLNVDTHAQKMSDIRAVGTTRADDQVRRNFAEWSIMEQRSIKEQK
ncbi:MAG: hypothetical protein LBB08_01420 [Rickettsiales bacterium]|jgi:hypothetical protein|nr:hypothetical protein [Rickettsiales bacterium]